MITGIYTNTAYVNTAPDDVLHVNIVAIPKVPEIFNLNAFIYGTQLPQSDQTSKNSSFVSQGSLSYILTKNPDLSGYIEALPTNQVFLEDLAAFIYATDPLISSSTTKFIDFFSQGSSYYIQTSKTPDLKSYILGIPPNDTKDLIAFIRPSLSGSNNLASFIRPAESGVLDLNATVFPQAEFNLIGSIVPKFTDTNDLLGFIDPIPPLDLIGTIQPIFDKSLTAEIDSIVPLNLEGTIIGVPFLNLQGQVEGVNTVDLEASYQGFFIENLMSTVIGVGSGITNLPAFYVGKLGTNIEYNLGGSISGVFSDFLDLTASYISNEPKDLDGFYEPVLPISLGASISENTPLDLSVTLTGIFFPGALQANITGTGGFNNLTASVISTNRAVVDLPAFIEGQGELDLNAYIAADKILDLTAVIESDTNAVTNLKATYSSQKTLNLSGSYTVPNSESLQTSINSIDPLNLGASIKPKFYYIESSIPINTYAIKDLSVLINANPCESLSFFQDLAVFIYGQTADTLHATVAGVQGQYSISNNKLQINTQKLNTYTNWQPILLIDPALSFNKLEIQLVTSPFLDLNASIIGVPQNTDLGAEITSRYYSIPTIQGGTAPIVNWVNTQTGESKLVRIFFRGPDLNYYYSDDANKTFSLDPFTEMVIVIERYDNIEDETILSIKNDVKQCVINNLERFKSIDEAIKFGIECAVGTYGENLGAYIKGVGGFNNLQAGIDGIDNTLDLGVEYNIVTTLPDLTATISGTGDFANLNVYLTPVVSSGTLSGTELPDLSAVVVGFGVANFNATISGS